MVVRHRHPPNDAGLLQAATENPGGWVYDVDCIYRTGAGVPPEAIRGSWRVDETGRLTNDYAQNEKYRPVELVERKPSAYMVAAARHLSDEWIVEIAREAELLFPNIPDNMKVGFWYVNRYGNITNRFRPNSSYKLL